MRFPRFIGVIAALLACSEPGPVVPDGTHTAGATDERPRLRIAHVDTRFETRDQMIASFEMQQSGEPLAEAFGRDLSGYDRNRLPTDLYADPASSAEPVRDLAGFAAGVESYEYSKYTMNTLALESGAGVSLAYGPVVNPTGATGTEAEALLRPRVERFAIGSHLGRRPLPGARPDAFYVLPSPTAWRPNVFGWRGLWPTLFPYRSFDPAIPTQPNLFGACAMILGDGDDGLGTLPPNFVGDYECDYATLHVPREALDTTIGPGSSGWAAWKYALWITNYLQILHDTSGLAIGSVAPGELALVGTENNTVVGTQSRLGGDPTQPGVAGTYLGSSDIEGFQAGILIDEVDNAAAAWLAQLSTRDGTTLSGFASVREALAYDYAAPLRWFPAEISVRESAEGDVTPTPAYAIVSSESRLLDLLGLLGAYAQTYGVTDERDPETGGGDPARAWFDGDPFPHDDQRADGEDTLHDRALAVMKVTLVDLDRLHRDPDTGWLVDTVTFEGATPTRGTTITTTSAAYTLVALRAARRAIGSELTLYSSAAPDTHALASALDGTSMAGAPGGANQVGTRIDALVRSDATLLLERLTTAEGDAHAGYDLATGAALPTTSALDDHTAAIVGLFEAFLATGDTRYRDRAAAVFAHMDHTLWSERLRAYRTDASEDALTYGPLRWALLTRALRQTHLLVGAQPGHEELARTLEQRITRMSKLVLDGWDDRDGDELVDWPEECLRVEDELPRGGLQMAERALTGEAGSEARAATQDRDHDCVPEIDDAHLPAALAREIRIEVAP